MWGKGAMGLSMLRAEGEGGGFGGLNGPQGLAVLGFGHRPGQEEKQGIAQGARFVRVGRNLEGQGLPELAAGALVTAARPAPHWFST